MINWDSFLDIRTNYYPYLFIKIDNEICFNFKIDLHSIFPNFCNQNETTEYFFIKHLFPNCICNILFFSKVFLFVKTFVTSYIIDIS